MWSHQIFRAWTQPKNNLSLLFGCLHLSARAIWKCCLGRWNAFLFLPAAILREAKSCCSQDSRLNWTVPWGTAVPHQGVRHCQEQSHAALEHLFLWSLYLAGWLAHCFLQKCLEWDNDFQVEKSWDKLLIVLIIPRNRSVCAWHQENDLYVALLLQLGLLQHTLTGSHFTCDYFPVEVQPRCPCKVSGGMWYKWFAQP